MNDFSRIIDFFMIVMISFFLKSYMDLDFRYGNISNNAVCLVMHSREIERERERERPRNQFMTCSSLTALLFSNS